MFGKLIKVCKAVQKLDSDKILKKVLSNTGLQRDIMDLNTQDQLYDKGIDSKGKSLGQYSGATIEGMPGIFLGKKDKGQRFDHITLNDTGEFYHSWKFKNNSDNIVLSADATKGDTDLTKEFGNEIIGLTEENLQKVREWVVPDIIKNVRSDIFT